MNEHRWIRTWTGRTKGSDGRIWYRARKAQNYKSIKRWWKYGFDRDLVKRERQREFDYVPSVEITDWKNNL
jgi:hypothetical protein